MLTVNLLSWIDLHHHAIHMIVRRLCVKPLGLRKIPPSMEKYTNKEAHAQFHIPRCLK